MKTFLKNNINFLAYFIFATIVELSTVFIMNNVFYIRYPLFALTLIGIIFSLINFSKSLKTKNIILTILLLIQILLSITFVTVYDNTGGTYFDFNMLKLIGANNDFAVTATFNFYFIGYLIILFSSFIALIIYLSKFQDKYYKCKFSVITSSICLFVFLISHISITIFTNKISEENFINSLYKNTNERYINLGSSSNAINELYKMAFFNKYNKLSNEEITNYIYKEVSTPSEYFGISKNNNLITVLVESLEWFAFISDPTVYPNGANLSEETLNLLYPNIREFYNNSVVMNNHHSENKTDMSEDEALLGSYPSGDYLNFSFENNYLPTSLANSLKRQDNSLINSFLHNNNKTFYNRDKFTPNLGYDNLYFIDEMVKNGATDYMSQASLSGLSMNLDSEMVQSMKDIVFTKDTRFNAHFSTVSMHGDYVYKENMNKWYKKLNDLNVVIENDHLKNYMAYVMEFDYALGLMIDDLKEKDLLNNTTIVIFSDHNTYMNHLTNYVKDIYSYKTDKNYNELFNVPLMIYDPNISHQIISKFTTTYDITPTLLDMFGINYYTNLYYGNSIFSEESSILYSKAFEIFISEGLYFSNINNILYKDNSITENNLKIVEEKCLSLLKKIYYHNHIFNYDYFNNYDNYNTFINNNSAIN